MPVLYKLVVSYNGFRFNGFQRQSADSRAVNSALRAPKRPHYESKTGRPKGVPLTIQECIEQVLLEYTGQTSLLDLQLRFAGRTDKGVHAMGQVVTVHFPETIAPSSGKVIRTTATATAAAQSSSSPLSLRTCDIATWEIQKAINSRLPVDISIEHVECLGNTTTITTTTSTLLQDDAPALLFDPRRDATSKQYSYTLKYLRKHDMQQEQEKLLLGGGIHIFRNALDPACMWYVVLTLFLCLFCTCIISVYYSMRTTCSIRPSHTPSHIYPLL
jgi:tRNA U38,U39,U40 pseudouridine synthase TruA